MRSAVLIGILIALVAAIAVARAGVLVIETSPVNGTTISATWLQGVLSRDVFFRDGRTYRQNMTLDAGPNRCFTEGAPGNDHAILITTASDDTGPSQPDAIVDCTVCGCEEEPNSRYTCLPNGRCAACNPCQDDTCGTGEACIRESCSQARCVCDPVACSGTSCDGSVTVASACGTSSCEQHRTCVKDSCGAACTTGSKTTQDVCDGDTIMRITSTCSDSCALQNSARVIEDCSMHACPAGTSPTCTDGGCGCA